MITLSYQVMLIDWPNFICNATCCSEKMCSYVLQEDAISEQLFQSSDNALDDLVWTADSVFSSLKVAVILYDFVHIISSGKHRYISLMILSFMTIIYVQLES